MGGVGDGYGSGVDGRAGHFKTLTLSEEAEILLSFLDPYEKEKQKTHTKLTVNPGSCGIFDPFYR